MTARAIVGEKVGMTQVWDEQNRLVPVTVLKVTPARIVQVKTPDSDGYSAVQVTFGTQKPSRLTKPELGHLKKAGAPPMRLVKEFRDEAGELLVGETVTVESFEVGQKVKISGTSKGKGFQGTIKRHNFASGP